MSLLDKLFGAKCASCGAKITGAPYETDAGRLCFDCNELHRELVKRRSWPFQVARSARVIDVFDGPSKVIHQMEFLDADRIIVAGGDEQLRIVDAKTLAVVRTMKFESGAMRFAADPSWRWIVVGGRSVAGAYDFATGRQLASFDRMPLYLDGIVSGRAGEVVFVGASCWKEIRVFGSDEWRERGGLPFASVHSMVVSHDGDRLLCGGEGGEVAMFDIPSARRIWSVKLDGGGSVATLAFAPDGEHLVAASHKADQPIFFLTRDGRVQGKFEQSLHVENRGQADFSADRKVMIVPAGGGVKVCHWPSRRVLQVVERAPWPDTETVQVARFSPAGDELYSGSWVGVVTRWSYHPEALEKKAVEGGH